MVFEVGQFDPKFILFVEGTQISEQVTRYIETVEFESADGIFDILRMTIVNPRPTYDRSTPFLWTDRKVFYPGNNVDLYMGYKPPLRHMCRMRLTEPEFNFPENGSPSIVIKGMSPDFELSINSPAPQRFAEDTTGKERAKQKAPQRLLPGAPVISDIVMQKMSSGAYAFKCDVDPTPNNLARQAFQRTGVSDYALIKALANISGFIFWMDHFENEQSGSFSEVPYIHFKDPAKLKFNEGTGIQEKKYTFEYGQNERSTLLSFQPTFNIQGVANKMVASITLLSGRVITQEVQFKLNSNDVREVNFTGDIAEDKIPAALDLADQILLTFNGYSIELVPVGAKFENEDQFAFWLEEWFTSTREQFIQARARTIGIETLMARQVHAIKGIGETFDGDYYVPRVKHVMSQSGGYICDMNLRKIVGFPPLPNTEILEPDEVVDPAIAAVQE